MKITFQTAPDQIAKQQAEKQQTERPVAGRTGKANVAYGASALFKADKAWKKEEKKSLMELQQDAENTNIAVQQDYMTVMSHTMSEEDYAQMEKEGFHFAGLDPETAVTIVDKIKAELVRSGKNIVGYTDDLDLDTLAAAVGSDTLAQAISSSFQEADIPLTPENIEGVKQAWNMASQLTSLEDGTTRYLVDNCLEPEVWNVYLAQNSGAESMAGGMPRYYAEDIEGYYAETAEAANAQLPQEQIDKVIEKAGLPVNEESRRMGCWLLENGLPLTEDNLQRLDVLGQVELPLTEESFAQAAAKAIAQGREPSRANLAFTDNLYEKAGEVFSYYQNMELPAAQDLAARRVLEEIRLRMTAEVNVKLLKSGFAIDTAPMEQLLEALKEAEDQLAQQYFPNEEQAVGKYQAYHSANRMLEELPGLPAQILGPFSFFLEEGTLSGLYSQGKTLQETYRRAGNSYEALRTAPRSDLGDSIRKAFGNVDAILDDLELPVTAENQRAVRILGYNHMDITAANIQLVQTADAQVQSLIEKMTPAAVLKMIRDGVNPLDKTLPQLEEYFDGLPEEYQESAESYSRFLYGLEKNNAVTEEEKETYIGVYRLLRQIEKSDGAVIGALVNSQAQLHLNNLLSAVRSGKFKHLDVKVSDRLGEVTERITGGESISDQISKAFVKDVESILTQVSYDEKAMKDYWRQDLDQIRQATVTDTECIALLQRGQVPANAENLLAAQALLQREGLWGEKLKRKTNHVTDASEKDKALENPGELQKVLEEGTRLWESLDDKESFREKYEEVTKEACAAAQEATKQEAQTSVEVRGLKLFHKQLALAENLSKQEEYFLSMYIGKELTGIHLTVENGAGEKGRVRVSWNSPKEGQLEAEFRLAGNKITASLFGNEEAKVTKLRKIADTFTEEASKHWEVGEITVFSGNAVYNERGAANGEGQNQTSLHEQTDHTSEVSLITDNAELYRIAKLFLEGLGQ